MTLERFKSKCITAYNSKGWKLLERVYAELMNRGIEPVGIETFGDWRDQENGERFITIQTVNRHNGTEENVTAQIDVMEMTSGKKGDGCRCMKRVFSIKVPKEASDKVIKNRIDKALEYI